jgi:hypothetical protein
MNLQVQFDRHARRRMKWRRITEEEVMTVIAEPDKIENSIRGRTNTYGSTRERYLKVMYKTFDDKAFQIINCTEFHVGQAFQPARTRRQAGKPAPQILKLLF